ncbi:hypothetical protein [Cellulophaga baltica]|uniref:hypothetical protein n=1 Tax=Cellulophaga baltica TaxID=76594 RepID=UPI0015F69120|nr:hypothetical protein [Cellulophaga baltica]MBA6316798.1 hypothetical protein [Cellulophaga baltica]
MELIKNLMSKIGINSKNKKTDMFYSYYIFGKSIDKPIWEWNNWKHVAELLQPIIDLSPELPFIKSSQSIPVKYGKDNKNVSYDKGSLRFGRMIWNESNNKKWTTKYADKEKWTFFDTEIAFPTRSNCHKNNINPKLFISVHNENLTEKEKTNIDQSITIHIENNLIEKSSLIGIEKQVEKIGELLNWKIGGKIKRPVSFKSEFGGFTDSFWDGSYGLLNSDSTDFSENYKRYGIEYLKKASR